jgi:hypothetical protein
MFDGRVYNVFVATGMFKIKRKTSHYFISNNKTCYFF